MTLSLADQINLGVQSAMASGLVPGLVPTVDATTGLYTAYAPTNSGDLNTFSVGANTPVQLVDKRSGQVTNFGTGPAAAMAAAQAASAISQDSGPRANWAIQTGDSSGNFTTVGSDKPDPVSPLQTVANIALPLAAGLIPGLQPLAAGLLGAATGAGLSGIEGAGGSQTLTQGLLSGLGAGAVNALGGLNALSNLSGAGATPVTSNIVGGASIPAAAGTLPADLSMALPSFATDLTGGLTAAAAPAVAGAAGTAGATAAGAPTVGELVVTSAPAAAGIPAAAAIPAAGALATALDGTTPVSGVDVVAQRTPTTATPSNTVDPGPMIPPIPPIIPPTLNTSVPDFTPTSNISVNPVAALPPSPTVPAMPPVVPPTLNTTVPDTTITKPPTYTSVTPAQIAKGILTAGTLVGGVTGGTSGGALTGTGTTPGLAPFTLDPTFHAALPDPSGIYANLGQRALTPAELASKNTPAFFDYAHTSPTPYTLPTTGGLSATSTQPLASAGMPASNTDVSVLAKAAKHPPVVYYAKDNNYARGGNVNRKLVVQPSSQRTDFAVNGPGTGRSDSIPAKLSDGEYVMDAETVAMLGDGSTKAGAEKLDQFRVNLRKQKGKNLAKGKISANAKEPGAYMSGGRA